MRNVPACNPLRYDCSETLSILPNGRRVPASLDRGTLFRRFASRRIHRILGGLERLASGRRLLADLWRAGQTPSHPPRWRLSPAGRPQLPPAPTLSAWLACLAWHRHYSTRRRAVAHALLPAAHPLGAPAYEHCASASRAHMRVTECGLHTTPTDRTMPNAPIFCAPCTPS